MAKTKVLVIDSCQIFVVGLIRLLSENERIELYSYVYSGKIFMETIEKIEPDIILIDSGALYDEGDTFLYTLRERYPKIKIIVLVPAQNMDSVLDKVIKSGARGILPKSINSNELVQSLIEMIDRGAYVHPALVPKVMEKLAARSRQKPIKEYLLSTREKEILNLVAEGESNQEIADALFLSIHTVKGHIKKISQKLKIENRVEMARYVLLNELIENRKNSQRKTP